MEAKALIPQQNEIFSSSKKTFNTVLIPYSTQKIVEHAVSALFPTEHQENQIQKARKILGETAINLTDAQIEVSITEFEYLITGWLDEFEKQHFDGKTLLEIIRSDL